MLVSEAIESNLASVPDLVFLVHLHTQLTPVFIDRTVVDSTAACIIDHAAAPLITIRECETHLYVIAHWPSFRHKTRSLIGIWEQHCLLEALIYDELVSHKIVVDLRDVSILRSGE